MQIKDRSGDKKYFTIIPNYILNHSTHWDREVYVQMKRIAGEDGSCFMSQSNLAEQCGMSINRLKKSIDYLIENEWIKFLGKKEIMTSGGIQKVNEYEIIDLWKTNINHYENNKGVSSEVPPLRTRGITRSAPGVSSDDDKEEPYKEEPLEEEGSSFKKNKKPFFRGKEMRKAQGRWWVLPGDGGEWLEFGGKEKDINWK